MRIKRLTVQSYRTLEDFDIEFKNYYTTISGRNDSGKTNVLRALRVLMSPEFPFRSKPQDPNFDDDFTKWIEREPGSTMRLSFVIQFHANNDAGIYQFCKKHLQIEGEPAVLELTLSLSYRADDSRPTVAVEHDGVTAEEIDSQQVLSKIRQSTGIMLHDSSGHSKRWVFYPSGEGFVRDFAGEDRAELEKTRRTIHRSLTKLAKVHRGQLESLMGRLEGKYKVGLTLEPINLEMIPYTLTLGDSRVEVPLEEWGSGTRNRTQILQLLFRARQIAESHTHADKVTPVLLVEEPESFLHPSAQAKFASVLQDICSQFEVQVIATTHSPHMLSHRTPESNLLLERQLHKGAQRRTRVVATDEENWAEPFAMALGVSAEVFAPWRDVVFPDGDCILLVEGETERRYIELLRSPEHGRNCLSYDGEIFPYGGFGNLQNEILIKFIKDKYRRVIITYDLDVDQSVSKRLESLGMVRDQDFFPIGRTGGHRTSIESLLPERIRSAVYAENPSLVDRALSKMDKRVAESATRELKKRFFDAFTQQASPGEDYAEFYKLARRIDKAFSATGQRSRGGVRQESMDPVEARE